eukprot:UN03840
MKESVNFYDSQWTKGECKKELVEVLEELAEDL